MYFNVYIHVHVQSQIEDTPILIGTLERLNEDNLPLYNKQTTPVFPNTFLFIDKDLSLQQ